MSPHTRAAALLTLLAALSACDGSDETTPASDADDAAELDGGDVEGDADAGDAAPDSADADVDVDVQDTADVPLDTPELDAADGGDAAELTAEAGEAIRAEVGAEVVLDGSASTGAVSYEWDPGDRSGAIGPSADPTATHTYAAPGRYRAVLTVRDASGNRRTDGVTVTVLAPALHTPNHSSTITRDAAADRFYVVSEDSDEVAVIERRGDSAFERVAVWSTCDRPRTVAPWRGGVAVSCQDADQLGVIDATGALRTVDLGWGARPFGVIVEGDAIHVALQGPGRVATVEDVDGELVVTATRGAIADARGLALLPDGYLAVTRWRSPDEEGQIVALPPVGSLAPVRLVSLAFDPQAASDTETGGVPTYLSQLIVSPDGQQAVVPSMQANIGHGLYNTGEAFLPDTTLRGVVSFLEVATLAETSGRRKQFDDRGFAVAATFSSRGDWLYVLDRGARSIDTIDMLTGAQSASIVDVGYAPEGLALTVDDRFLLVDATLSREVVVYDVRDLSAVPVPVARVGIPSAEPLEPVILRGKQLFNDALDERLAQDSYIACAHCHLDGESDHRTWDFTDRGEGLRNTISLLGRAGMGHGPVHWSANFDEIHDFENDIRGPFGGSGLMTDADFEGPRSAPLGEPKAGLSADLDALAAYVATLDTFPRSPFRNADGTLTDAAIRGRDLFTTPDWGCLDCHSGPQLTDSAFLTPGVPLLHDVGTLTDASGQRLGGPLEGLDTPTLHELWNSAPYLHDGSAATLYELFETATHEAHSVALGLEPGQLDDVVTYLLSLEGPREGE